MGGPPRRRPARHARRTHAGRATAVALGALGLAPLPGCAWILSVDDLENGAPRVDACRVAPATLAPSSLGFDGVPPRSGLSDGDAFAGWHVQYTSHGEVHLAAVAGANACVVSSGRPARDSDDEWALVTSDASLGDFDASLRLITSTQLRAADDANVARVVWRYENGNTYYFVALRPDGWEIGRHTGEEGDVSLEAAASPVFPVGAWYRVRVRQVGGAIQVWVGADGGDCRALAEVTDPSPLIAPGSIGLNVENAQASFAEVLAAPL